MPEGPQGIGWQPSQQALDYAKGLVTETDIPLHIARYVVVKMEKHQPMSNSDWLKWLIADETKARTELRRTQASERKKGWADVED